MSGTFSLALQAILTSVRGQLLVTPTGWPNTAREYVVPGTLAWDQCECGLLAIEWLSAPYTSGLPNTRQALADGCRPLIALQIQVTVLRCAPSPGAHGEPPDPAELAAAAIVNLDDLEALLLGTATAVKALEDTNVIQQYALSAPNPVGPEGGCVGVQQQLFIGFSNRWGPC